MGIYQEIVFSKYGQHSSEALFYNVCISSYFISHLHGIVCVFVCVAEVL